MAYEKFKRTSVRVNEPTLSVALPSGRIFFNAAACRLLEKAHVRAVVILWDQSTCGIAFQAAQQGDMDSFAITMDRATAKLGAKSFLKQIGWSFKGRLTVAATWDAHQKMFEVKLPSEFVGASAADSKRKTRLTRPGKID